MKAIEINIPDELLVFLGEAPKNQEKFVLEAIREKLARDKKHNLKSILMEGYKANYAEDLATVKEFESTDFENL